ncbi:MAG: hypothetical protein HC889_00630 [Synechococcaceae cyanobacterium SM1_2_3]|nr:hypothetical protein [Synechococcaceae cyanobacterium SM1_2_3]
MMWLDAETYMKIRQHGERWTKWWAWHPVHMDGGVWVWLEFVERRWWAAGSAHPLRGGGASDYTGAGRWVYRILPAKLATGGTITVKRNVRVGE